MLKKNAKLAEKLQYFYDAEPVTVTDAFRRLLVASEASKGGSFSDPGSDHDD